MEETELEAPRCVALSEIGDMEAGGKAQGLSRLMRLGLRVPPGFVLLGASRGKLPGTLSDHYAALGGGCVAVRSSATGEDALDASFAGQYGTVLDVEGLERLREAIDECLSSLDSVRAVSYRQEQTHLENVSMSVVVQCMVDAAAAGVLFTADPVSGRRNCLIVETVAGRGEQLVSGQVTPDHFTLTRAGEVLASQQLSKSPLLTPEQLKELAAGAALVEEDYGRPMDLEWAVGKDGLLYWLQARPITRLGADPNELDAMQDAGDIYTSCNIGECMPGAITPLTFSTVWHADDQALQLIHVRCGVARGVVDDFLHSRLYYGRMFINLTKLGLMSTRVVGATSEQMTLALCGRAIPELDPGHMASMPLRLFNGLRFMLCLLSAPRHKRRLEKLAAGLSFPEAATAGEMYEGICARLGAMYKGFDHHMVSSTGSGALEPALMQIMARRGEVTEGHHARVAALLAGASDLTTESADIVMGIHRVVDRLVEHPDADARFAATTAPEALEWISSEAAGSAAAEFRDYMRRHGHRSIRELELRQPEWNAEPLPVIASMQAALRARAHGDAGLGSSSSLESSRAVFVGQKRPMRGFVRVTQKAVERRERTKSLLVAVVTQFKGAYRRLGELLAAEGKLADADAVFFLTHKELAALLRGDEPALAAKALERRKVLDYQMDLSFPDVFTGSPEPLEESLDDAGAAGGELSADRTLRGKPVSRGRVAGRARVVRTLAEAGSIQPGEILIAPVTDVGWSPYFSLVAGLATDVGSSVSHGAVVAREYGLPAVVDLRRATKVFKTGDLVVLDGDHGVLRLDQGEAS
jgi:phosphohistidine swiveling domain-containing protein